MTKKEQLNKFVNCRQAAWMAGDTLIDRSRDNLPNSRQSGDQDYVTRNLPAIGDWFEMFNFK